MITDEERREVARRLREYASWYVEEDCLVDCADWGERVLNLLGCGDMEGECYAALADLIEPSGHECMPGECPINVRHDNDKIDRDALLALADECGDASRAYDGDGYELTSMQFANVARRIREALGVES